MFVEDGDGCSHSFRGTGAVAIAVVWEVIGVRIGGKRILKISKNLLA
jgi:hypothetical protein